MGSNVTNFIYMLDGNANTNNIGEKGYEKVEGEEGVVVQEKYYKMWL